MPCAKILIVDNSTKVREFCQKVLGEKYKLTFASNSDETEEKLAAEKPDLIIMDIYIPRVDGLTLAEKFKSDPEFAHIPIIILSGIMSDMDLPPGFWKMGTPAQGFLHKPVEPATLLNEVQRVLAASRGIKITKPPWGGYL
jgi:CheY-like chemotaxis protein